MSLELLVINESLLILCTVNQLHVDHKGVHRSASTMAFYVLLITCFENIFLTIIAFITTSSSSYEISQMYDRVSLW